MDLSVITAAHPMRVAHLSATASSVDELRKHLDVQWILAWDGQATMSVPSATIVLEGNGGNGISCTRNLALSEVEAPYVTPLDADDLIEIEGCVAAVEFLRDDESSGWVALNRTLMDGARTPHWKDHARTFRVGELAEDWLAPFTFHPNSIMFRTDRLLTRGGWPAVPTNEDLALILIASEYDSGSFLPAIHTRYRTWEQQEVARASYPETKKAAFRYIERIVNAIRSEAGRDPIAAPGDPGPAFGAAAIR